MAEEKAGAIIGRKVRRLRDGGLWTREELAAKAGVSRQTIAHLELGTAGRPRRGTIEKLAEALDVPIETLLAGTDGAAEAPLPRTREECAFVAVRQVEKDENGDEWFRWVVKWGVPQENERGHYREIIAQLTSGADYREEEMSPEKAAELIAAVV